MKKSKKKVKLDSKTLLIKPSIVVTRIDGKKFTYVLEGNPMTRKQYEEFQTSISGDTVQISFAFRVVQN